MLTDFREYVGRVDTFMTHCSRGKNRSPSVAVALNDIFNLGNDSRTLIIGEEVAPNHHVFKTLEKIAKELGMDTSRMQKTWKVLKNIY